VFRDYILTLTLCTVREFKHIWYQIYKADYCFKHLKLVHKRFTESKCQYLIALTSEGTLLLSAPQTAQGANGRFSSRSGGPVKKLDNNII